MLRCARDTVLVMEKSDNDLQIKAQLRRTGQARRDALPAEIRKAAAEIIAARAFPLAIAPGMIASGFMPLKSEINPLPLMRKLTDAGARLALPVVAGRGKPLIMRSWQWGEPLVPGVWGIREPPPTAPELQRIYCWCRSLHSIAAATASAMAPATTI